MLQTTLVHLNGNLLCSVDVKTTGQDAQKHEIYEIGIIPIDSRFERRRDRIPLDMLIRPNYEERIDWQFLEKRNYKKSIEKALVSGIPQETALELFERWFLDLQLPIRKKIAPVGHDYGHEGRFLRQWFGHLNYATMFDDSNIRDTKIIACFLNDLADVRQTDYPFKKVKLPYLATTLGVYQDYGRTRSALHDAAIIADVYRSLIVLIRQEMLSI